MDLNIAKIYLVLRSQCYGAEELNYLVTLLCTLSLTSGDHVELKNSKACRLTKSSQKALRSGAARSQLSTATNNGLGRLSTGSRPSSDTARV